MIDFTIAIVSNDGEKSQHMAQAISEVFTVAVFPTAADFLKANQESVFEMVLIDFNITDMSALDLQQEINKDEPKTHTVMITSIDRSKCVVESMKKRAMDYIYHTDDSERFQCDVCKIVRYIIEEQKRRKAEIALHETGLYHLIKDKYEDRNIDIDAIKKEAAKFKKERSE